MGGHGGLNILPQKSWHVYRADNRSKVEKDEAEARVEDEAARSKHADAEREFRRQVLLHRKGVAGNAAGSTETSAVEVAPTAPASHINFWSEDEARLAAEHPEVAAEKKQAAKKRGKADFYTTDAKFDEKFQLGYQMSDIKPWYAHKPANIDDELNAAKHGASTPAADKAGIVKIKPHGAGKRRLAQAAVQPQPDVASLSNKSHLSKAMISIGGGDASHSSNSSSSRSSNSNSSDSDSSPSSRHDRKPRRHQQSSSHSKKSKSKSGRGKDKQSSSSKHKKRRVKDRRPSTAKSIEQLRAERIEREHFERTRERHVLLGAMPVSEPQGYNSGFGYAASLRRPRR